MAHSDDFFDTGGVYEDCDSVIEGESRVSGDSLSLESELRTLPCVIHLNKRSGNYFSRSKDFTKADIAWIESLFGNSGCFSGFVILREDESGRYSPERPEEKITVRFGFLPDFHAMSFRWFIIRLCNQLEYVNGVVTGPSDVTKEMKMHCFLNPLSPESTVFSAFYVFGFLDKYVKELGMSRLFNELNQRVIVNYYMRSQIYTEELHDLFTKEYYKAGLTEATALVPLFTVLELPQLYGVKCAMPFSPESNAELNLGCEFWRDREGYDLDYDDIDEASKGDSIRLKYDESDDFEYFLTWFGKIIYIKDTNGNDVPFVLVSLTENAITEKRDSKDYPYHILLTGPDMDRKYTNLYFYFRKFLVEMFEKYRDCFESYMIPNRNGNLFHSFYKLRKNVDAGRFYKFVKDVIVSFQKKFYDSNIWFCNRSQENVNVYDRKNILENIFHIFCLHHLENEFLEKHFSGIINYYSKKLNNGISGFLNYRIGNYRQERGIAGGIIEGFVGYNDLGGFYLKLDDEKLEANPDEMEAARKSGFIETTETWNTTKYKFRWHRTPVFIKGVRMRFPHFLVDIKLIDENG